MKARRFTFMTAWKDNDIVCCCPIINRCSKNHGCEELEFILNPYDDIKDCMKARSYKRNKHGALERRR